MIYRVSYDLRKPGEMWLVIIALDADGIWRKLRHHVGANDSVLIIGVTEDYSGQLRQAAGSSLP